MSKEARKKPSEEDRTESMEKAEKASEADCTDPIETKEVSAANINMETAAELTETPTEGETSETEQRRKLHKGYLKTLRNLVIRIALLALVVYILFFHLVGITVMPNGDMYPRIDAGDLVLFYRLERNFHAQDIIVFEKPTASLEQAYMQEAASKPTEKREKSFFRKALDWIGFRDPADPPKTLFVCRIVAGPGDTVEINSSETLIVNGNTVIEPNIFYRTPLYEGFVEYPLTLGEGQYFVLADSRNGGADSRFTGPVNEDEILGTVITILRRNNL